jgi:hypothetical protein
VKGRLQNYDSPKIVTRTLPSTHLPNPSLIIKDPYPRSHFRSPRHDVVLTYSTSHSGLHSFALSYLTCKSLTLLGASTIIGSRSSYVL